MGILVLWLRTADLAGWLRALAFRCFSFYMRSCYFFFNAQEWIRYGLLVAFDYPVIIFHRGMIRLPLFSCYSNLISRALFRPCCAHVFQHRQVPLPSLMFPDTWRVPTWLFSEATDHSRMWILWRQRWPWAAYVIPLYLSFFVCDLGVTEEHLPHGFLRIEG